MKIILNHKIETIIVKFKSWCIEGILQNNTFYPEEAYLYTPILKRKIKVIKIYNNTPLPFIQVIDRNGILSISEQKTLLDRNIMLA